MPFLSQFILAWLLLSFAFVARKDLRKALYLAVFFMPAYLVRFTLFGIPTTALEIMIYILFACWLFGSRHSLAPRRWIRGFLGGEKLLSWGIVLLFAGMIFSTLRSADLRTSLGALKGFFLDPLLFFMVYTQVIRDGKEMRKSLLAYVLSGFAVALLALLFAAAGSFTFDGRLRAFYESPNYLAMYLAPALLFALYLFGFGKGPASNDRKLQAVILAVLLLAILLTRSYGAVLGIGAALTVFFFKDFSRQNLRLISGNKKIFRLVALAALLMFLLLSVQKAGQIREAGERSSLASRFMIWTAAGEMLRDSPVFGIGPGTFQATYLKYQSRFTIPYLEWAVPQPHNTFLAFYLQTGIVGFIGFLLLLSYLAKRARSDEVILLFLVYFPIHGFVDTLYWKNDLALIFALVLGAAYVGKKKQPVLSEIVSRFR